MISISDLIFLVAFENEILKKIFRNPEGVYRGQKNKSDISENHYASFVARVEFVTPI
jgi:hypothetical protein